MRALPQLIAPYLESRFTVLGTDGFGRSDTRVTLRRFFEVDARSIVVAALAALARDGSLDPREVREAIDRYQLDDEGPAPWTH